MIPSVFMCLDKFLNDQLYNIDKKIQWSTL